MIFYVEFYFIYFYLFFFQRDVENRREARFRNFRKPSYIINAVSEKACCTRPVVMLRVTERHEGDFDSV